MVTVVRVQLDKPIVKLPVFHRRVRATRKVRCTLLNFLNAPFIVTICHMTVLKRRETDRKSTLWPHIRRSRPTAAPFHSPSSSRTVEKHTYRPVVLNALKYN